MKKRLRHGLIVVQTLVVYLVTYSLVKKRLRLLSSGIRPNSRVTSNLFADEEAIEAEKAQQALALELL